jgi:hypothetical protein
MKNMLKTVQTINPDVIAMAGLKPLPTIVVDYDFFEFMQEHGYEGEADIAELAEAWTDWLMEECE